MATSKRSPRTPSAADPQRGSPQAMLARIQSLLPSMGAASQRIGEFVISHPADVVHMSVSEVAERTQCSEGSVVGFCKLLGATGFQ